MQTKVITTSKKKTDRNDALALANLHAVDYVPTVWQATDDIVTLRRLVAYYCSIKKQKVLVKNRVHGMLQRNLVSDIPCCNIFTQKGRRHLLKVELPPDEKQQVLEELGLLAEVEKNMLAITKRIAVRAIYDTDIRRLLTITGVNMITAVTIKSAIGDIKRFPHPKKLVSYFGLGTAIYQSANSCFYGKITKRGNVFARSALVQSAQVCVKFPSPLRAFFQRLYQKKGRNKSIIAVASKLTRIIWHMLTNGEDYRYENKALTRIKMLKLNSLAGVVSKRSKRITDKGCGAKAEREYKKRGRIGKR
jgi:transposase